MTVLCGWVVAVVVLQWLRLQAGFHYEFEDDALYHQILANGTLTNTIHPLHRPSHLPVILLLLHPLHALLGGGWGAVFLLKALFIGSGSIAIVMLGRSQGLSQRDAEAWGLVYLLFPPTLMLTFSTFRALSLAIGPLLFVLWAFCAKRWRTYLWLLCGLLLFREDLALSAVFLAGVAWLRKYPARWTVATIGICAAWFLVTSRLILPQILPAEYDQIIVQSNLDFGGLSDATHWVAVATLLAPLLFLPLGAWEASIGIVGLASILLHKSGFAGNLLHLMTPAVAGAMGGAVLSYARIQPKHRRNTRNAVFLAIVLAHMQPWIPGIVATEHEANGPPESMYSTEHAWSPFHQRYLSGDEYMSTRLEAVQRIPKNASVSATGHFLPLLTPRDTLYEYGHRDTPFADVDWIILEGRDLYSGAGAYISLLPEDVHKHRQALEQTFHVEHDRDGILIFKRIAPGLQTDRLRNLVPRRQAPPSLRRGVRSPGEETP